MLLLNIAPSKGAIGVFIVKRHILGLDVSFSDEKKDLCFNLKKNNFHYQTVSNSVCIYEIVFMLLNRKSRLTNNHVRSGQNELTLR